MKALIIITIFLGITACGASNVRPQLENGLGEIPSRQFSDAKTIKEIRDLKPQASVPLNVAILTSGSWNYNSSELEREAIKKWGDELKKIGFIESYSIIPNSLKPKCGYKQDSDCYLDEARKAGARLGADTILFLNNSAVTDAYANPLSILNLTIVGLWVVPAHHRESYAVYEASLFDIDNGYLYAVAESESSHKVVRPWVYAGYDLGQATAKKKALEKLGKQLFDLAKKEIGK